MFEDLALCHYSQELLGSLDAQDMFVPPDRRKMKGFVADQNEEDEWVLFDQCAVYEGFNKEIRKD